MSVIFFLIGCSVFIALIFLGAFFWANKTGQHDDTYTPAIRMLFDDDDEEETDERAAHGRDPHCPDKQRRASRGS